jgi:signal peptidase I
LVTGNEPTDASDPPRATPVIGRVARVALGSAVTVLCVVLVWWWATGGTWLIVSTPSMGRYAPVGSLLWVRPTDIGDIRTGDVVTFTTPKAGRGSGTRPTQTYTHRVVARYLDGTLETKGDINAAKDPWPVHQGDLVGRVEVRWWGIGWLVKALPLLFLGGIAWWVLTAALASGRSRAPLRVLGAAVLAAVALNVYQPLFGATRLSFVGLGPPGARATYVGTGLLPVRLEADDVPAVLVHAGDEQSIVVPREDAAGRFQVRVVPMIPWQTWLVVAAACLAPALWSVIVGAEPPPGRHGRGRRGQLS